MRHVSGLDLYGYWCLSLATHACSRGSRRWFTCSYHLLNTNGPRKDIFVTLHAWWVITTIGMSVLLTIHCHANCIRWASFVLFLVRLLWDAILGLPWSLTKDRSYEEKYNTCDKEYIPESNFDLTLAGPLFFFVHSTQINIVLNCYFYMLYQV